MADPGLGSRPPTFIGGGTAGTGTRADPFRRVPRTGGGGGRAGGGGGGATASRTATQAQKVSKNNALNTINKLISQASGAERTRLIQERINISNIAARDFTSSVTLSVKSTISRGQEVAREQESKARQQEVFEKQIKAAKTATARSQIISQARRAGFIATSPRKITVRAGPTLEEGRLDVTARGKRVLFEEEKKEGFVLTTGGFPLTLLGRPTQQQIIRGEITAAVPPKLLEQKIERLAEEFKFKAEFREEDTVKQLGLKAGAFGLGVSAFFVETGKAILSPIETTKGLFQAAKQPGVVVSRFQQQLAIAPEFTLGKVAGFLIAPKIIGKGIKGVKEVKIKVSPVKIDIAGKKLQLKTITSQEGLKIFQVAPAEFKARFKGERFAGFGEGVGAIGKRKVLGAEFGFEISRVTRKGKIKDTARLKIAEKAIARQRGEITTGISLTEVVSKIKGKRKVRRFVSPFKVKEFIGGEFPRAAIKTGIAEQKKRLTAFAAEVGITRKVAEVQRPGQPRVEFFETLERGLSAKQIDRIFGRRRLGKKAQARLVPEFQPGLVFGGIAPETIISAQFFKGARAGVREFAISKIKAPGFIIFPLDIGLGEGLIEVAKSTRRLDIGLMPIVSPRLMPEFKLAVEPGVRPRVKQESILGIESRLESVVSPKVLQLPRVAQRQLAIPGLDFAALAPVIPGPVITPLIQPGFPILFGGRERAVAPPEAEGFDVIIREKGQDLEFDKKRSFPRQRAKNIGADIVDNSAAASFRIRKSKQPIDSMIDDNFFSLGNKFRSPATKSKLPPKQFIEKTDFRIDSAGELAGITAKGLIARRKKAMRNQFLDFGFSGGISL